MQIEQIDKKNNLGFSFLFLAILASIGMFGQASILHNTLVHSYPFKMMSSPPAEFYASVGNLGYYFAIGLGLFSIIVAARYFRGGISVFPLVVCPLIYWIVFEVAHLVSDFGADQMRERNFEGYTGNMARYKFGFEVLVLMVLGSAIGLVSGLVVARISTVRVTKLL